MQCSKEYTISVESGACCLTDTTSIATTGSPQGMCYAITDNRIFAPIAGGSDVDVIDPTTDTLISTILGVGANLGWAVYSPVNNRVYVTDLATFDIQIINPTLMTHVGTITAPVGVANLFMPSYDSTNDVIYIPGNDGVNAIVYILDPIGATIVPLISDPIAPMFDRSFNRRVDHCTLNDRIYVSMFTNDGIGGLTLVVRGYSSAGVLQTTINVPGAVSGSTAEEQIYWSQDTGLLYLLANEAIAGNPGAVAINPTTELVEGTMSIPSGIQCMGFAPTCNSINILDSAGVFKQFNQSTYASICDTDLTTITTVLAQMATADNGRVFAPDFNDSTVHSLHPP